MLPQPCPLPVVKAPTGRLAGLFSRMWGSQKSGGRRRRPWGQLRGVGNRGVSAGPSCPPLKPLSPLRAKGVWLHSASANSTLTVFKQKPKTVWELGCVQRKHCPWVGRLVKGGRQAGRLWFSPKINHRKTQHVSSDWWVTSSLRATQRLHDALR